MTLLSWPFPYIIYLCALTSFMSNVCFSHLWLHLSLLPTYWPISCLFFTPLATSFIVTHILVHIMFAFTPLATSFIVTQILSHIPCLLPHCGPQIHYFSHLLPILTIFSNMLLPPSISLIRTPSYIIVNVSEFLAAKWLKTHSSEFSW